MRETLKLEDASGANTDLSVTFGMHKQRTLSYFHYVLVRRILMNALFKPGCGLGNLGVSVCY